MNVRVNEAGQKKQVVKLVALRGAAGIAPCTDCCDLLALYHERGWSEAVGSQDAS